MIRFLLILKQIFFNINIVIKTLKVVLDSVYAFLEEIPWQS